MCAYYELGHLVGGGRRETWATNSKLRQNKEEDEVRGRRIGDDFSIQMCWNMLIHNDTIIKQLATIP